MLTELTILGFDWASLPRGSVVVDVGGGIGSTSMLLASAFSPATGGEDLGLRFVIQDRAVVVDMGEKVFFLIVLSLRFVDPGLGVEREVPRVVGEWGCEIPRFVSDFYPDLN